jgi:hypothetical protein
MRDLLINKSLEKNYFRTSLLPDVAKSFSQFPPSVYRRSLAASKIQRGKFKMISYNLAWRMYKGRKLRNKIRKEQHMAACIIQRMARKKLRKIKEQKNIAAGKIQKAWRRKRLIWVALLRCIYRQTIKALHNAATVIQRKWRHWHSNLKISHTSVQKFTSGIKISDENGRYASLLVHGVDLEKAANTIIHWWRPLFARLVEIRRSRWVNA